MRKVAPVGNSVRVGQTWSDNSWQIKALTDFSMILSNLCPLLCKSLQHCKQMGASPAWLPGRCLPTPLMPRAGCWPRSRASPWSLSRGLTVLRPPSAWPAPTLSAWASQTTPCFAGTTWVYGPFFHLPACKNVLVLQEPDLVLRDVLQFAHFFQKCERWCMQNNQNAVLPCVYIWHKL